MERNFRLLDAKVSNLEKQIEFLLRVNGLDLSKMRNATDEELLGLYQDAAHLLAIVNKGLDLGIVERWSEFFLQLSEYEFTRLQPIVSYEHPWEPFFELCAKMMTHVRQHKQLGESTRIQRLYALLDKGRRNIRDAAVVMCQKYPETLPLKARTLIGDDDITAHL